jgi:ubiquinone/menaquinone biosynthesis C-methylase UbiE
METQYVHDVYDKIASHFDTTRYSLWGGVKRYLESIAPQSSILDIGTGNGKALGLRKDCVMYACDPCEKLVNIAKQKHPHADVIVANGKALPYRSSTFDAVLSIAVLHHLESEDSRLVFLKEMHRVMKPGGRAFITVWATDAQKPKWKAITGCGSDFHVPWTDKAGNTFWRYYHLFDQHEITTLVSKVFHVDKIEKETENWHLTLTSVHPR